MKEFGKGIKKEDDEYVDNGRFDYWCIVVIRYWVVFTDDIRMKMKDLEYDDLIKHKVFPVISTSVETVEDSPVIVVIEGLIIGLKEFFID